MSPAEPLPILRDLLAGRIEAPEAARRLLALIGPTALGMGPAPAPVPNDDAARLNALMPAVRWEMAKRLKPDVLPDVPYGSPEYHEFIAGVPSGLLELELPDVSQDALQYHLLLLTEAGLIEFIHASSMEGPRYLPTRLTWLGHEFLDPSRSESLLEACESRRS